MIGSSLGRALKIVFNTFLPMMFAADTWYPGSNIRDAAFWSTTAKELRGQISRGYQVSIFKPSTSAKCASRVANVKSYCTATAAIQMSFSGMGRPFMRSVFLI